jgi:hypothetical protein
LKAARGAAVVLAIVVVGVLLARWIAGGTDGVRADPRVLPITTTNVAWSPDGLRIAAASNGVLHVFRVADGREVLTTGRSIVAFAWMPDAKRILVAEGPIPTGEVATVDLNGRVTGVAHLSPSIDFDAGYGLSVNSDGTQAVAVAVHSDDLGGHVATDLATIELATGAVHVAPTPDVDERSPVYVDDETVAYLVGDAAFARDLATGEGRRLGPARRLLGIAPEGAVVALRGCCTVTRLDPSTGDESGAPETLTGEPTAADPTLRRFLVLEADGSRIVGITE